MLAGSLAAESTELWFLDYNDNKITTPNADMKIYVTRTEPAGLTQVDRNFASGHGNLWVQGIFPVA